MGDRDRLEVMLRREEATLTLSNLKGRRKPNECHFHRGGMTLPVYLDQELPDGEDVSTVYWVALGGHQGPTDGRDPAEAGGLPARDT